MTQLQKKYKQEIIPQLQKDLHITNVMATPRLEKIVINMGVKDATSDKKLIDKMVTVVTTIAGQRPKVARAKKSIASFKLRQGDPIGVTVTLRGKKMYDFMERLTKIVLPRVKDFHGVSKDSFDGRGNYALGFREYSVFPEIDLGTVDRLQGLEVIFVTNAKTNERGITLLKALGIPFQK